MNESKHRLNTSLSSQHSAQNDPCMGAPASLHVPEQYTAAWQRSQRGAPPPRAPKLEPHAEQWDWRSK